MKTAISLPDHLFRQAELAARRLHVSRSEFYSRAIAEFLATDQSASVTEQLNALYAKAAAEVDSRLQAEEFKLLEKANR